MARITRNFPRVVLQIVTDRDLKSRSGRYGGCQSGSYGLLTLEGSTSSMLGLACGVVIRFKPLTYPSSHRRWQS